MSIRLKLILPILILWMIFYSGLHFVWKPDYIQHEISHFQTKHLQLLFTLESGLVEPILSQDLKSLHSALDIALKNNFDWVFVSVWNTNGVKLYPLNGQAYPKDNPHFHQISYEIKHNNDLIATVELITDGSDAYQDVESHVTELETYSFVFLALMLLITVLYQEFALRRPLARIMLAADTLAKGDFSLQLPQNKNDEIGQMAKSFVKMREKLRRANSILEEEAIRARQSEQQSRHEYEEHLRGIIHNVIDGIITINTKGAVTSFNKAAETMFGYTAEEIIGRNVSMLIADSSEHKQHDFYIQQYLNGKHPGIIGLGREVNAQRKNGEVFPIDLAVTEYHQRGQLMFVGVVRDITVRKEMENEMQRAKELAEHASKLKSQFLANMSHEIRTPLNGLLGMLELVRHTSLDSTQQNYIETAQRSGKELLHILNEILDLSKIEAGRMQVDFNDLDPHKLMEDIIRLMQVQAQQQGLELTHKTCSKLPHLIYADSSRIRQVLTNLISNALKFTHAGKVDIQVHCDDDLSTNEVTEKISQAKSVSRVQWLTFSVTDTGIGIPADKQQSIFDEFSQADGSTSRKYGGTGLGLAICKKLVDLMGGKLTIESCVGKGSTFSFTLPVGVLENTGTHTPREHAEEISIHSRKVLIAEDNLTNQMITKAALNKLGTQVVIANNGQEALEQVKENHFDLVLMDIQMPVMNGIEAAKAIRQLPGNRSAIPIIALTADATPETRQACIDAGIQSYITKPVDIQNLSETLSRWLQVSGTP